MEQLFEEDKTFFRMAVCGIAGSGKTLFVSNLLSRYKNHFNKIYIFLSEPEPIYDWLLTQIPGDLISIYYDFSPLRKADNLNDLFNGRSLCIFDNTIIKSKIDYKIIMDLFVRARVINNGVSLCFLSQSWFHIPKIIKQQINYCVLLQIITNKDLRVIKKELKLDCSVEQLQNMYNYCCFDTFGDVLLIDRLNNKYRKNFLEFLNPKDF
jgi:hypothetical protein